MILEKFSWNSFSKSGMLSLNIHSPKISYAEISENKTTLSFHSRKQYENRRTESVKGLC